MEAVFSVADRITVMVNGTVIASGDPASIRLNREVRQAYLGEEDAEGDAEEGGHGSAGGSHEGGPRRGAGREQAA